MKSKKVTKAKLMKKLNEMDAILDLLLNKVNSMQIDAVKDRMRSGSPFGVHVGQRGVRNNRCNCPLCISKRKARHVRLRQSRS